MTRKEEILKQAVKEQSRLYQSPEWRAGFISGAMWADKTMLAKVCKWLEEYVHYAVLDKKIELAGVELSEDLRKSMLDEKTNCKKDNECDSELR